MTNQVGELAERLAVALSALGQLTREREELQASLSREVQGSMYWSREATRLRERVTALEQALSDWSREATRLRERVTALEQALSDLVDASEWPPKAWLLREAWPQARALLPAGSPSDCDHKWVSARNEAVESGEMCVKCHAIRAEAAGSRSEQEPPHKPDVLTNPGIRERRSLFGGEQERA